MLRHGAPQKVSGEEPVILRLLLDCAAEPAEIRPAPSSPPSTSRLQGVNLKNIFVGNLDFGASEESIRTLFSSYGNVDRVSIVTDRETGRSRGFAFVEMSDSGEADRAIDALNGYNMGGRALNVNEARPKTNSGGGGGGGGYRQRREPRW
ncbi:RNA recognition motif domain-containing protein [Paludibaculum fermentans]|uniref:RNA recognition motif domain-containing protein n=1 Tax=Paludibaculum fermentans TaxID=1473598 RepID=UPI001E54C108|nr:RNA-binding protein [Paludibaculum fermentans]